MHYRRRAALRLTMNDRVYGPSLGKDERGSVAFEYLLLLLVMGIGVGVTFLDSTFKVEAGNSLRDVGQGTLGK
jgi:hypothetical protein